MKKICVYCGSSPGKLSEYIESAVLLADELVKRDMGLVYGGASVGIMGEVANAVLERGGEVIGIIPHSLAEKELSHTGLTQLNVVSSMHERKAMMAKKSDGFIALPGGIGTLEEIFEVLTWSQLGFHSKPCAVLNVQHYYDSLMLFLDHVVEQGFVKEAHRNMLLMENTPGKLLDAMASYKPPITPKWLGKNEI